MEYRKLSIKNFIGDLPNIINGNFEIVKNTINKLFDADTQTITVTNASIESKIITNSLITNNLKIVDERTGKLIDFAEILTKLEEIQVAIKSKQLRKKKL